MNCARSAAALALALLAAPVAAETVSGHWVAAEAVRWQLIVGDGGLVGIHGVLDPGWKTYWRWTGRFGYPPKATVSGLNVVLQFPAPRRLDAYTVGYANDVTFLFRMPKGAAAPVVLDYAICSDVCIPGRVALTVADRDPALAAAALARIPPKQGRFRAGLAGETLTVTFDSRQRLEAPDIFVDGVETGKPVVRIASDGASAVFDVPITGKAPKPGKTMSITVVDRLWAAEGAVALER